MKKYFTFIFLIVSNISIAQCDDVTFSTKSYPQTCVENIIKWYNMSRSQWKQEMNRYDFSDTGFNKGAPYYSSGVGLNDDGILYVITKDFDHMEIMNFPINKWDYKRNIFDNIIEELEPFFTKKIDGWAYFQFQYTDGNSYLFAVSQSKKMDSILLMKK
ncbi:hypothetical protein D6T69_06825 [Tenacibaculum singaporense]|uniref:Uncharacterized protein n=1 Tax=Tenacibaculum singaporense TaxID=2358479 RepID=A0A3S8R651_9FLAO|nr:hypothetical protein [Tenacibaculum singaporense]AZJ35247.1 hypothetical protein D6T69_06825 [Tenacibaculum singaporense]